MEDQKQTSFTFEIDNFSETEGAISSPTFSSGRCEWRASYSFVLLNQSGKELFRKDGSCKLFCAQFSSWGRADAVPLQKLQEKGFMEKNKLIVKVEVKVVEVVDQGDVTGKETFDFMGFRVLYSQVGTVSRLFGKHPDIAINFRPKNQLVKTTYINILLGLIETLNKRPHNLSETELSNARSELIELTEAGFKLDWLKTKLAEVTLERKKPNSDGGRVQELEKEITTSTAKVLSLEQRVPNLQNELSKKKAKSASPNFPLKDFVLCVWNTMSKSEIKRRRSGYEKLD
ncbi:unnamed protein product [Microthlaspi erraticum]|uniref:MATH domain-containing protein n=1 Tax=Microthlaspi erraticum TaxID=1685480 RepID=A0A6D2IR71_9BRAS|nr:unnamed protein product [Microthlaspi erraticum]